MLTVDVFTRGVPDIWAHKKPEEILGQKYKPFVGKEWKNIYEKNKKNQQTVGLFGIMETMLLLLDFKGFVRY